MATVLIPVGTHFFTPAALEKALANVPLDLGPNRHGAAVATVDNEGAKVALIYTSTSGNIRLRTAYSYDWSGEKPLHTVGADVLWRF